MIAGYFVTQFAQAYGQGSYGGCTYNATTCASTSSGSSSGGQLTNTGVMIAGFVTLACLIVFASLLVRFWRRKSSQQKPLAEEADESPEDQDDLASK